MNILQVQDRLKGRSEQQLAQEMQMPSGMAPQFLVLSELQRRKRVRDGEEVAHFYGSVHRVTPNEKIVQTFGFEEMPDAATLNRLADDVQDLSRRVGRLENQVNHWDE